jgi:hypothetical protein
VFTTSFPTAGTPTVTAPDHTHPTVQVGTQLVTVVSTAVAVIPDPNNSADSALVIIAPAKGSTIVITPSNAARTAVSVTIKGQTQLLLALPSPLGLILVYGQSGKDTIEEVSATIGGTTVLVSIPAILLGCSGTAILPAAGSSADNILVGESSKSTLTGDSGNDILIGGGPASLHAGTGDDILIAGSTNADADVSTLLHLISLWLAPTLYELRVQDLFAGPLALSDVVPAPACSHLFGGSGTGQDWFWLKAGDALCNYASGDVVTRE